jgi:hypothetical protein
MKPRCRLAGGFSCVSLPFAYSSQPAYMLRVCCPLRRLPRIAFFFAAGGRGTALPPPMSMLDQLNALDVIQAKQPRRRIRLWLAPRTWWPNRVFWTLTVA